DTSNHRTAFRAVAVEQQVITVTVQDQIKLPYEVPDILQPDIHALAPEWAMDVRGIARDEHAADAQPGDLPVMHPEIAAPVQAEHLDLGWRSLAQDLLDLLQRRRVPVGRLDRRHDAPASGAHGEDRNGAERARAQLELIGGKGLVRLNVSQQEQDIVFCALE